MTYFNFLNKVKPFLKSVRILKNHVSFDMLFSDTWVITKNKHKDIEIIKGSNTEDNKVLLSFVCPLVEENINNVEEIIDGIIKSNREREEKDKLFRSKVHELKKIFERQKLEELKALKFDLDEFATLINEDEDRPGDREGVITLEGGEEESEKGD